MEQAELKAYAAMAPIDERMLEANSSYAQILALIDGPKRIVDFGCGPGNLARFLARRGCTIVGVDINPEHAVMAREYCEDVLVADLDSVSLSDLFPVQRFDVAVFADILEHLRDPGRLVAQITSVLQPGGYVIASIPNIAHGAVRLALLDGDFDYKSIGLLDDTHLRFFTRKTMEAFFEKAGLVVEQVTRTIAPIFEPSGTLVPAIDQSRIPEAVIQKLRNDPDTETLQFVVRAVPADSSAASTGLRRVAWLERRVQDLEANLHSAKTELAKKLDVPSQNHLNSVLEQLHVALQELAASRDVARATEEALTESNERVSAAESRLEKAERRQSDLTNEIQQLGAVLEIAEAERTKLEALLRNAQEAVAFERQRSEQRDKHANQIQTILQHQVEQVNALIAERNAVATRMDDALLQIESLENRLTETAQANTEACRQAESEAHILRAQVREADLRADQAEFYLNAMRHSKFWQIRNAWFKFKGLFGVTSDIP